VPGLQTGPPPWGNETRTLTDRLPFIDLDPLPQEALDFHIHQQLDVFLDGKRVTVPALIGIDTTAPQPFITEVHTHDASGLIHNESATDRPYTLGQLFGEWAVRLDASCLGNYCGHLRWWLAGRQRAGNPADLVLVDHQHIVIASGRLPAKRPAGVGPAVIISARPPRAQRARTS
jgi:hypothetical protein